MDAKELGIEPFIVNINRTRESLSCQQKEEYSVDPSKGRIGYKKTFRKYLFTHKKNTQCKELFHVDVLFYMRYIYNTSCIYYIYADSAVIRRIFNQRVSLVNYTVNLKGNQRMNKRYPVSYWYMYIVIFPRQGFLNRPASHQRPLTWEDGISCCSKTFFDFHL